MTFICNGCELATLCIIIVKVCWHYSGTESNLHSTNYLRKGLDIFWIQPYISIPKIRVSSSMQIEQCHMQSMISSSISINPCRPAFPHHPASHFVLCWEVSWHPIASELSVIRDMSWWPHQYIPGNIPQPHHLLKATGRNPHLLPATMHDNSTLPWRYPSQEVPVSELADVFHKFICKWIIWNTAHSIWWH